MPTVLAFEKPLAELKAKLDAALAKAHAIGVETSPEAEALACQLAGERQRIFSALTPWQKVLLARHPDRPYTRDYIAAFVDDFTELHVDRQFADDASIVGGIGWIEGRKAMVIGTQKGRDTASNVACNFGCPFPEGYRKALRLMKLAARFRLPILTLIDTPGAFPGTQGEERHVAAAIAVNLREMFNLPVPVVSAVIGEGGSGGALALGVANRILIMEYAYYSVISPEGCAAILWKDRAAADKAAAALRLTSSDLLALGIADGVVPEPPGGAHIDPAGAADRLRDAVVAQFAQLEKLSEVELIGQRYGKFRALGVYESTPPLPLEPPPLR